MATRINSVGDIHKFCHFLSSKKRNLGEWSFLTAVIEEKDEAQAKAYFDEVIQYLEFQFQDDNTWILSISGSKKVLLVTPSKNTAALLQFDKNIYENFPSSVVRASASSFRDGQLALFSEVLKDLVPQDDIISSISFMRMRRQSNVMMVLDDDIMVLKQMEKVLEGFGSVVTVSDHTKFLEEYKRHAPNILFLDVHLGKVRGPNILEMFLDKIDPYAHVVIISSDTKKETVRSLMNKGVRGYVAKPFNQQQLLEHVMKAETFCARSV